jgi:hypothetical protein
MGEKRLIILILELHRMNMEELRERENDHKAIIIAINIHMDSKISEKRFRERKVFIASRMSHSI